VLNELFFIKGVIIGLIVALPLGPIGILCIQRTLSRGYLAGLFTGLGIAAADAVCGAVATFGVTVVSDIVASQQFWFRLIGGIVICGMGGRIYHQSDGKEISASTDQVSSLDNFFWAFILTVVNPALILSFFAIFATMGLAWKNINLVSGLLLVSGVFSGSAVWWLLLSGAASRLRRRFTDSIIRKVNRISGIVIAAFGLFIAGSSIFSH
jgi:threonine/homoserine/homoserine lactone efflux protein